MKTQKTAYKTAKPFLQSWLPPDVMQTIESTCDLTQGCVIKRQSKSYDGLKDTITVRFDTLRGNQFEVEFVYDIKLKLKRYKTEKQQVSKYE